MKTVAEYKAEIKTLRKTVKKTREKNLDLFCKAEKLFEGKYAVGREDDPYAGMGARPFYYVYKNDEDREREENDKEQWLVENGYYENEKFYDECWEKIEKLEAELCWAEHGMCKEEWAIVSDMNHTEERIKKYLALAEEEKANLEGIKKKLAEYRANKK